MRIYAGTISFRGSAPERTATEATPRSIKGATVVTRGEVRCIDRRARRSAPGSPFRGRVPEREGTRLCQIRPSPRPSPSGRAGADACLVCAAVVMSLLAGCGAPGSNGSGSEHDVIERSTEKGPVKLSVRVWPREPRLSDLVEMDVVIESRPGVEIKPPAFGQAVGDFLIRDYSERPPRRVPPRRGASTINSSRHTRGNTLSVRCRSNSSTNDRIPKGAVSRH
jgi:hypothetical protein